MATISTSLRLTDNMSSVLSRVIQAMNRTAGAAQDVRTQVDRMGSSSGTDRMRQSVERTSTAFQNTAKQIQNCTNHQNNFITKLREGATAADGLWDKIKGVAATYLSLQGVKDVLNLSDSLSNTSARLNMINDGSRTTAQLQDKIYQSAQRTRSNYLDTASAVSKMVLQTGNLFKSNDEAIAFAENLNKMYAVTGATQEEQYSATLQLTQALGSGVLRGDELNAVFEAAPNVIQAIADYINVPIGKIRDMAKEGQISSTIVKNAMLSATNDINQKFEQMPITFAQVWSLFKNYALQAFQPVLQKIGQLTKTEQFQFFVNQAADLVAKLADAALQVFEVIMKVTDFIYKNWSTVGPILKGIVTGLLAWKAAQELVDAVTKASPVVIIFAAIAAAIGYCIGYLGGFNNALMVAGMCVQEVGDAFQLFGMEIYDIFATATGRIVNFFLSLFVISQKIGASIENFFAGVWATIVKGFQDNLNVVVREINKLIDKINEIPFVPHVDELKEFSFGDNTQKWANHIKLKNTVEISNLEFAQELTAFKIAADYAQRQSDISNQQEKIRNQASKIGDTIDKMHADAQKSSKVTNNNIFKTTPSSYSVAVPKFDPSMLGGDDDDKKARKSTAKNTKKTADAVSKSAEDLRYLRDYAFRQIIQRETTLSPSLNTNVYIQKVDSERDLDGVANYLNDKIFSAMQSSVAGVHTA